MVAIKLQVTTKLYRLKRLLKKALSLYTVNCTSCHGEDGKMGASGAKDLSESHLSDKQIKKILQKGKNAMPPMSAILENEENMDLVIQHIKTLRK